MSASSCSWRGTGPRQTAGRHPCLALSRLPPEPGTHPFRSIDKSALSATLSRANVQPGRPCARASTLTVNDVRTAAACVTIRPAHPRGQLKQCLPQTARDCPGETPCRSCLLASSSTTTQSAQAPWIETDQQHGLSDPRSPVQIIDCSVRPRARRAKAAGRTAPAGHHGRRSLPARRQRSACTVRECAHDPTLLVLGRLISAR